VLTELGLLAPRIVAKDAGRQAGLLALGEPLFTTAGKTALGWAFKAAGLVPGDRVLLPAYHCLAMVEPLEWLGLEPVFYRLHEDLSIDLADLEARLDNRCKALVAVHYFGFPQDGPQLRGFCDHFGLALIEDCAHSFFGSHQGERLGSFGDFAIGSLPKFFPLRAGGCLVSRGRPLPRANLAGQGALADLQALVRELQTAHYYGRLRPLLPATTGMAALAKLLTLSGLGRGSVRPGNGAAGLNLAASGVAKNTLRSSAPETIVSRRRENYETLCRMLSGLPGVTLLKPRLEPGVVPYMLPLRIPALRRMFARLEDRAFPMQRFGQFLFPRLDPALCPVSSDLSHHGLQLPCHQSLRSDEIEWMVERLADICRTAGPG
jgi:dTDP-4-amino-4,6-dideoxygalactose transaminase